MRAYAFAVLAFVLGLVVGGYRLRAEVRELEDQLDDARDASCAPGLGQDMARLLTLGAGGAARNPYGDPDQIAAEHPEAAALNDEMREASEEVAGTLQDAVDQGVPADELQAARTALELRRAQARAALVETAEPTPTQLLELDLAVKDMNERLLSLAEDVTGALADGEPVQRRDAMVFAAETLDALIATEDRFTEILTDDQLDAVDLQAVDPFSYLDPALVDTFAALGAGPDGR